MAEIKMTSRKEYEIVIPEDLDLDTVNKVEIRGREFVEVVRCKDCRWHEQEQPGMVYCPATVGGWVENDWFCKGGERKDDELQTD